MGRVWSNSALYRETQRATWCNEETAGLRAGRRASSPGSPRDFGVEGGVDSD